MQNNSHESLEKKLYRARLIFNLSFYPLLILYIVFATPLLGNFAYLKVHNVIGTHCPSGNASGVVHCFHNGVDIGTLLAGRSRCLRVRVAACYSQSMQYPARVCCGRGKPSGFKRGVVSIVAVAAGSSHHRVGCRNGR
jgi:hypothetical protein